MFLKKRVSLILFILSCIAFPAFGEDREQIWGGLLGPVSTCLKT